MGRDGESIGSYGLLAEIGAGEGKETLLEYLLCAQSYDKYFTYIFKTHNKVPSSLDTYQIRKQKLKKVTLFV